MESIQPGLQLMLDRGELLKALRAFKRGDFSVRMPLNLTGILDAGERVRAATGTRIAYRDGIALAVMEGDFIRPLTTVDPAIAADVASALAGRRVPPGIYVARLEANGIAATTRFARID